MLGVGFIFSGISHSSSFGGNNYWKFDPGIIAIGSGFLVWAFLLFDAAKDYKHENIHARSNEESEKTPNKIHFSCDKCGTKFVAAKEQLGKPGKCNNCGAPILVPGSG